MEDKLIDILQTFSSDVNYTEVDAVDDILRLSNVRLSCFQEVWQKWCESKSTQEFDEWLHARMHKA